ncbi:MAG: hypothetical protein PHE68_04815 [Candidatus Peribacteraceae bacterium]|nr:hypothetical protein [Candidatus Peribacteraceae bacterium]MDD5075260.1 hypothetical protein [Candidatus Peribacteraceae bacterium]
MGNPCDKLNHGLLRDITGSPGPEHSDRSGFRVSVSTDNDKAVIAVTAPLGELMQGRVSHHLPENIDIAQDSTTLTVTLSGAPLVTYKVEPMTKGHVSIVLNVRDANLVVPKARGRFLWIEVTIQLPEKATWSLVQPVASVLPVLVLHKAIDGIISAEGAHAARQRRRREEIEAAAAPLAMPPEADSGVVVGESEVDPPPSRRKKSVSGKKSAKRRSKMKAERKSVPSKK